MHGNLANDKKYGVSIELDCINLIAMAIKNGNKKSLNRRT